MFGFLTVAILTLLAAYCSYILLGYRLSPLHKIPGPKAPSFLVGNLREVWKSPPCAPQLRWAKEFGGIVRYRGFLGRPNVLLTDPDGLKRVLVTNEKNYIKPRQHIAAFKRTVGDGLLATEGAQHALQRKRASPAFRHDNLKQFILTFCEQTQILVEKWTELIGTSDESPVIDLTVAMKKLTLDIIGLTAFGYAFEAQKDSNSHIVESYRHALDSQGFTILRVLPGFHLLPTQGNRRSKAALQDMRNKVIELIELEKRDKKEPSNLLGMLVKSNEFPDKELVDQILTFMLAGHETTSVALCWCFYLLSQPENQDAYKKAQEELKSVLNGKSPTFDDFSKLPYLCAVVKESLRLYPSVPITSRIAVEDDTILGYDIPAGTRVFITPWATHRRPCLFDEPDTFNPERWLSDKKHHHFSWLPFLAGQRSCIGSRFAQLEFQSVLAVLLQKFELYLAPNQQIKPRLRVTLQPTPRMLVIAKPIKCCS